MKGALPELWEEAVKDEDVRDSSKDVIERTVKSCLLPQSRTAIVRTRNHVLDFLNRNG